MARLCNALMNYDYFLRCPLWGTMGDANIGYSQKNKGILGNNLKCESILEFFPYILACFKSTAGICV